MSESRNMVMASTSAGLVAGPLFLVSLTLLSYQEQAGAVIEVNLSAAAPSLLLLAFSIPFGMVLAFPTCLLVGSILAGLAAPWPLLRSTALWLMIAAGIAVGIVTAVGFDLESGSLAFALTAVGCAAIIRSRLHWD